MARPRANSLSALVLILILFSGFIHVVLWISFLNATQEFTSIFLSNNIPNHHQKSFDHHILFRNQSVGNNSDPLTSKKAHTIQDNSTFSNNQVLPTSAQPYHFLGYQFLPSQEISISNSATPNGPEFGTSSSVVAVEVVQGTTCDVLHKLRADPAVAAQQHLWEPEACVLSVTNAAILARGAVALISAPSNGSTSSTFAGHSVPPMQAVVLDAAAGFCCENESSRYRQWLIRVLTYHRPNRK
jgi:hypothetical protein